jgi:hypothetical protein
VLSRETGGSQLTRVDDAGCGGWGWQALDTSMECGVPNQCSFAGVWAPDLPDGMTVYGMSYFYERPMQAKATHPKAPDAEVSEARFDSIQPSLFA